MVGSPQVRKEDRFLEGPILAALDLIKEKHSFVLATHRDPDGDAIGSMVALYRLLLKMGKRVKISWDFSDNLNDSKSKSIVPLEYSFILSDDEVSNLINEEIDFEVFIALDCGNEQRLGGLSTLINSSRHSINIDHHRNNPGFAHLNLIDVDSPATSEIVYRLMKPMENMIDAQIATALYVGLVTDTGRFQYSNTGPSAFIMAADLLRYDVNPARIYREVYETRSISYLKISQNFLSRVKMSLGVIHSFITQDDLESTGVFLEETEDLINILRSVREAKVAFVLKEKPGGDWKISLRSKGDVDVSEVAVNFGGGGHKGAAGFISQKSREDIVKELLDILKAKI